MGSAGKRKRGPGGEDARDEDDEEVGVKVSKEEEEEEESEVFWMGGVGMGGGFGAGGNENAVDVDADGCVGESPVKRAKREGVSVGDAFASGGRDGGESGGGGFADVV